jgi:phage baseplate assembly protein W
MAISIDIPNRPYWQPKLGALAETVTGIDDVAQGIELLLSTLPGSVPLLPEYGFDWIRYLDRPMNVTMRRMERDMLKALRRWEPRVEVVTLKVEPVAGAIGVAVVCLTWKLCGSNEAVIQVLGLGMGAAA